ncbi:MarR family winged helix-turn-helix transcriptional regulator [Paenibacillus soyae]|uniref:MarR family transcriptional regulator n=1 Tax=Paenibacillus soyae TaxID=2969249 RepID=A0A9X2SAA3_9BACL|nr:MarR family transcriptional regulator [Paenibacillus soyae]MCR2803602.1 MarR family transcriptional regulator [Paenibacillus soyae]
MEEKDWSLLEEADWAFRKLVRRFVKERDKISVEGLSLPGLLILNSILQQGEQRLGELAEQFDFTSGAVTALVDKLEAGGYAVRTRSEEDRRTVVLGITEQGRELLKRNRHVGTHMIRVLLDGFSPEELRTLTTFHKRLQGNVERFADEVLTYAEQNKAEASQEPAEPNGQYRSKRFISY